MNLTVKLLGASCALALAWSASAQIPFTSLNGDPAAANAAFALQNPRGPSGNNYQVNYPYPGQCVADTANGGSGKLFPALATCGTTGSFSSPSQRTAGGWAATGLVPFKVLNPITADSTAAAAVPTPKFVWEFLNPPDYTPDQKTFPGADYYEMGVHEAWGFQDLATLDLFPDPTIGRCSISLGYCDALHTCAAGAGACNPIFPGAPAVPDGMQWTGLVCTIAGGCSCPADAAGTFKTQYCSFGAVGGVGGKVPFGYPLYTPVWGVGQINMGGTAGASVQAVRGLLGQTWTPPSAPWSSNNNYYATWPSISIRSVKGRPVVVKWVNEFPNNHVLCPHPEAADWPCAIDRTFMGVKATLDPAVAAYTGLSVPFDGVNQYGSPQQPDNSWVTHLHGGEIPPSVDGFAEKWYGNSVTAPIWTPDLAGKLVNPAFENPSAIALKRPGRNYDTYTYPMVNDEATIWFHDHTLGKTHHNVIAGPAGFAPTWDPTKHGGVGTGAGTCPTELGLITTPPVPTTCTADYTWLDPVTRPTAPFPPTNLNTPIYDLYIAIQDRSFNDDGSFNFSNGLGQPIVPPPPLSPAGAPPVGYTPVTNGVNPQVHPVWIPEYFNDHALVNGVLWPKKSTEPGWYRMRIVDGSDSRCYNFGFMVSNLAPPAPGTPVTFNVPFYVIANDQGYLRQPAKASGNNVVMCPGERYEILVDFGNIPGVPNGTGAKVYMVNNAKAPYPAGVAPTVAGPFAEMNTLMLFDVNPAFGNGVKSCGAKGARGVLLAPAALNWNANNPNGNMTKSTLAGSTTQVAAGYYDQVCMPDLGKAATLAATLLDGSMRTCTAGLGATCPPTLPTTGIVRQVYLNERIDGVTLAPMGMQLNGVPFEYKVTETPKKGTVEVWKFINLTVDTHPMHPHFVRHQIVERQNFNVGQYKKALCGSTTCQPGTAPGGEMQVVPDVTGTYLVGAATLPFLTGMPALPMPEEGGWKDTSQVPPGMVTTIVADWTPRWAASATLAGATAPGTAGCLAGRLGCPAPYIFEDVTSGPYVWHCHINSHEDSEMMRTSLVVP